MLSICIPVYNQDVEVLVKSLLDQLPEAGRGAEICLLDDGSDLEYRLKNKRLASHKAVRYLESKENRGRSISRNQLAFDALNPWLLFLDCDVCIPSPGFLKRYLDQQKHAEVVCGGHVYAFPPPKRPYYLHWLYGSSREARPALQRMQKPYQSFMTANFMIRRDVFARMSFDEQLSGYGHEDTLFGMQLKEYGLGILHIDNPVVHEGLETTGVFLDKTRQALLNLVKIQNWKKLDVRILSCCRIMRRFGFHWPLMLLFSMFRPLMESHLAGRKPRLRVYDFYKLGFLCKVYRRPLK